MDQKTKARRENIQRKIKYVKVLKERLEKLEAKYDTDDNIALEQQIQEVESRIQENASQHKKQIDELESALTKSSQYFPKHIQHRETVKDELISRTNSLLNQSSSATVDATEELKDEHTFYESKITRLIAIGRNLERNTQETLKKLREAKESNEVLEKEVAYIRRLLIRTDAERLRAKEMAYLLQMEVSGIDETRHRVQYLEEKKRGLEEAIAEFKAEIDHMEDGKQQLIERSITAKKLSRTPSSMPLFSPLTKSSAQLPKLQIQNINPSSSSSSSSSLATSSSSSASSSSTSYSSSSTSPYLSSSSSSISTPTDEFPQGVSQRYAYGEEGGDYYTSEEEEARLEDQYNDAVQLLAELDQIAEPTLDITDLIADLVAIVKDGLRRKNQLYPGLVPIVNGRLSTGNAKVDGYLLPRTRKQELHELKIDAVVQASDSAPGMVRYGRSFQKRKQRIQQDVVFGKKAKASELLQKKEGKRRYHTLTPLPRLPRLPISELSPEEQTQQARDALQPTVADVLVHKQRQEYRTDLRNKRYVELPEEAEKWNEYIKGSQDDDDEYIGLEEFLERAKQRRQAKKEEQNREGEGGDGMMMMMGGTTNHKGHPSSSLFPSPNKRSPVRRSKTSLSHNGSRRRLLHPPSTLGGKHQRILHRRSQTNTTPRTLKVVAAQGLEQHTKVENYLSEMSGEGGNREIQTITLPSSNDIKRKQQQVLSTTTSSSSSSSTSSSSSSSPDANEDTLSHTTPPLGIMTREEDPSFVSLRNRIQAIKLEAKKPAVKAKTGVSRSYSTSSRSTVSTHTSNTYTPSSSSPTPLHPSSSSSSSSSPTTSSHHHHHHLRMYKGSLTTDDERYINRNPLALSSSSISAKMAQVADPELQEMKPKPASDITRPTPAHLLPAVPEKDPVIISPPHTPPTPSDPTRNHGHLGNTSSSSSSSSSSSADMSDVTLASFLRQSVQTLLPPPSAASPSSTAAHPSYLERSPLTASSFEPPQIRGVPLPGMTKYEHRMLATALTSTPASAAFFPSLASSSSSSPPSHHAHSHTGT